MSTRSTSIKPRRC